MSTIIPKIYITCHEEAEAEFFGQAITEDGVVVCQHISRSVDESKEDMGWTTKRKAPFYKAHYPDGYVLEWVEPEDMLTHQGLLAAWRKNFSELGDVG